MNHRPYNIIKPDQYDVNPFRPGTERVVFLEPRPYPFGLMRPRDIYKDWRLMTGLVLTCLGAANWIIGLSKTQRYSSIIELAREARSDQSYRRFDELDAGTDRAVLEPFTAQQRRVSYAAAHMDFYHATYLTGVVLFTAGTLISLIAFIAALRREGHRSIRAPVHRRRSDIVRGGKDD